MKGAPELDAALRTKSLTAATKALSKIADELGYWLKPPYTEILELKAQEEGERYSLKFKAKLYLHYARLDGNPEGLIFTIAFGGNAFSDTPTPPIDELFYAGLSESLEAYGYGPSWRAKGPSISAPTKLVENLELSQEDLVVIDIEHFLNS